jgi:predicted RND superfamily exporter protein
VIRFAVICWERWRLCLLLVAAISAAALPLAQKVRLDLGVESLYPSSSQAVADYERVRTAFGTDEVAAIHAEDPRLFTPDRLSTLGGIHKQLEQLPFVERIDSLFTLPDLRDEGGLISTAPVLARIPPTDAQAEQARQRAIANPLLRGQLVSADGTALMLILRLSPEYRGMDVAEVTRQIENILTPHQQSFTRLFQAGDPFTQSWMRGQLADDQRLILPLALVFVLVLLTLTQRSFWAGVIPVVNAGVAIIWTLALMRLTGLPVNFLNSILPALIVIIGATSDVHFVHEFRQHLGQGMKGATAISATARRLALPLLLTSITTVLGFATTALSDLPILRDFGLAATLGMSARFFVSALFLPACLRLLLRFMTPSEESALASGGPWTHRFAAWLVGFLLGHARLVLAVLAVLFAAALWQAGRIRAGNDLQSFIRSDSPVRVRDAAITAKLAGLGMMSLVIQADKGEFLEPRALRQLEALGARLRELPGVSAVTSFADLLGRVNSQLRGGDEKHARVPEEASAVRQMMLFLHAKDHRAYLTPDFSQACLQLRCDHTDSKRVLALEGQIHTIMREQGFQQSNYVLTGSLLLVASATDSITSGQVMSLGSMMMIVFLIVWCLFLSARCGVTTLVVNVFPVAMIFGIMGLCGISLNVGTCMVAAITLGIAVDDTLHLLVRFNREARRHKDERKGIEVAIREELAPIATTTVALASGFAALGLSSFQPVREFGLLSAGVMVLGLITDMIVTPVLFGRTRVVTLWDVLGLQLRKSLLETSPFFAGLNSWQARRLILASNVVEFEAGDAPVHAGDVGDSLYVVLAGELEAIAVRPEERKKLRDLHPGDVFGEMAFITQQPRTADIVATTPARLLKINFDELTRLRRFSPFLASQLLFNISRIVCERVARSRPT